MKKICHAYLAISLIALAAILGAFVSCAGNDKPNNNSIGLVKSVLLDKTILDLNVGDTEQLRATVLPNDALNKNVNWASSTPSVATVTQNGLVAAIYPGTATITVTTQEGNYTATCNVTVITGSVKVTNVTLIPSNLTLQVGGGQTIIAQVAPENAANKSLTWNSLNQPVATVNNQGVVTAHSVGTTRITATALDGSLVEGACDLTVVATPVNPTGVTMSPNTLTLTVGGTYPMVVSIQPSNATNKAVHWASNNINVAVVNDNGLISAVSQGSARITATTVVGSYEAFCNVTVEPAPTIRVDRITLDRDNMTLTTGDTGRLTHTISPANATNKDVRWLSDNESVATVTGGVVTAVRAGSANIAVETVDGGHRASCQVRVVGPGGANVYAAGNSSNGPARLWTNQVPQGLGNNRIAKSVFVSDNGNVYVAGNTDSSYPTVFLWKDGAEQNLGSGVANSVYVSGNDVYVAGYEGSNAVLWKNGARNTLGAGRAFSVVVSGNDVYVAGYTGSYNYRAVVWKNSAANDLGAGIARSVFVSGNVVYAAGDNGASSSPYGILWENGVARNLSMSSANSVFVSGYEVYVAGYEGSNAILYKNTTKQSLGAGVARSVFVSGSDVYVAGSNGTSSYYYSAVVWKNGDVVYNFGNGNAYSVFVK